MNCILSFTGKQTDGRFVHRCCVCLQEYKSKSDEPKLKANCPGQPERYRMVRPHGVPFAAFKPGTTPKYIGFYAPLPDGGEYVLDQQHKRPVDGECIWESHRNFGVVVTVTVAGSISVVSPHGTFSGQAPADWNGNDEEIIIDLGGGFTVQALEVMEPSL